VIEAVKETPRPPVFATLTPAEINHTYNEWMKIAADNVSRRGQGLAPFACGRLTFSDTPTYRTAQKINVTNTWNMALIDYFQDLSLVRDSDGDGINFQKASCTLEGCVKVYASRVESVSSETAKLLNGLASAVADAGPWAGRL
jgi:condensin complex subunit 2